MEQFDASEQDNRPKYRESSLARSHWTTHLLVHTVTYTNHFQIFQSTEIKQSKENETHRRFQGMYNDKCRNHCQNDFEQQDHNLYELWHAKTHADCDHLLRETEPPLPRERDRDRQWQHLWPFIHFWTAPDFWCRTIFPNKVFGTKNASTHHLSARLCL